MKGEFADHVQQDLFIGEVIASLQKLLSPKFEELERCPDSESIYISSATLETMLENGRSESVEFKGFFNTFDQVEQKMKTMFQDKEESFSDLKGIKAEGVFVDAKEQEMGGTFYLATP